MKARSILVVVTLVVPSTVAAQTLDEIVARHEVLPGGPAYRLKVTLKSGAVRHVWVDAASGLVVRTLSMRTLRGHEVALETVFGDYRETGGVAFARSIETGVPGRPRRLRILVETVEVNIPIDDSRFRMPR